MSSKDNRLKLWNISQRIFCITNAVIINIASWDNRSLVFLSLKYQKENIIIIPYAPYSIWQRYEM